MLHLSVSCCKCFVFYKYVQRVMGHGSDAAERGRASQGPADGTRGDTVGVQRVCARTFGTVRWNPILSDVREPAIS
jgi:hypothetical protein